MIHDIHYSTSLYLRMRPYLDSGDYEGLLRMMQTLSNAQFRTAGYIIGERFAPVCGGEAFWQLFAALVGADARAFLVTMLKALRERMAQGVASIHDAGFAALVPMLNAVDREKVLCQLLPVMGSDTDVCALLERLEVGDPVARIRHLLPVGTLPCLYVLFANLRYIEHDRLRLVRICHFLIKRGDTSSFNLASLMKAYFGLDEVRGTFSLNLKPFQLSRIENSYPAFCQAMRF